MPDTLTPPGASGSTPSAPTALTVTGAGAVPVEAVAAYGDPAAISLDLTNATRARLRLGAASSLATLNLDNAGAALEFAELVLPASVDSVDFGTSSTQGAWVDQLIDALPDRSSPDDGTYTDDGNILTVAQETALGDKGFNPAV